MPNSSWIDRTREGRPRWSLRWRARERHELRQGIEEDLIRAMSAEGNTPTLHAIAQAVARTIELDHLRIAERLEAAGERLGDADWVETHRCSVEGCPNLAAFEVVHYAGPARSAAHRTEAAIHGGEPAGRHLSGRHRAVAWWPPSKIAGR